MSWTVSGFLVYLFILSLAATPTNTECLSALLEERPCQAHFWFTLHSPLPEEVTPILQPPVGKSDSVENFPFSYLALFPCLHQRKLRFKRSQQIAHCCTTCKWQSKDLIRNMWIQRLLFFTIKVAYQKTGKTPAKFLKTYILEISGKWKKSPIFFLSSETRIVTVLIYFLFIDSCLFTSELHPGISCVSRWGRGWLWIVTPDGWHADASWSSGKSSSPAEFEFWNSCGRFLRAVAEHGHSGGRLEHIS